MALPAGLSTFTLTGGPYTDATGTVALAGVSGKLTPVDGAGKPVAVVHAATGAVIVPQSINVTVDETGSWSAAGLPYTDDAALAAPFRYSMAWNVAGRSPSPGDKVFEVPSGSGSTVDFDLLGSATGTLVTPVAVPLVTSVAGYTGAVTGAEIAADPDVRAALVPFWEAGETVTAGTIRMAPDGTTIERNADGTTGATYDTTEQAAWTAKGGGGTTLTPGTTTGDILVWDGDSYEPQTPAPVTASDVPFTPAGTLTATDVQAAIEQAASSGSGSSAVVGARIRLTANVTLAADGAQHQVAFNGQVWSYGGMTVDVTANNNKIVVPVKGLYQWTGTAYPAAAAVGDRRLIARVNYTNVGEIDEVRTTTAQEFQMTPSSFPLLLNAGDTVTADFYATGGGNVILYGTNASFTWMSLVLIGTVP